MPIWNTKSIVQTPEITLNSWRIFEVSGQISPKITRHFVGYNIGEREGRVSSAIVTFDAAEAKGVTSSGRVYHLYGGAGFNPDAEYVWDHWKFLNQITSIEDVTEEIVQSIKELSK